MVRVWLRPALVALRRQAALNAHSAALRGASQQAVAAQQLLAVRAFSSKKDKHEKKKLSAKFEDIDEDPTELPPDVKYMSKETSEETWGGRLDPEFIKALQEGELIAEEGGSDSDSETEDEIAQLERLLSESDNDEEEFLDDGDDELSDAEWVAKYERELAKVEARGIREVEDDRLYIEMPHRDSSLLMATDGDADDSGSDDDDSDDEDDDGTPDSSDPFSRWDQGMAYSPEMLNWMKPEAGKPMAPPKNEKPWKYFVRANHPDVVELAMDTDLLRLFIAPTGRIRPRRFTGLTAKQQRQVARAIKISRQLALLPYLSRYPEPSPEQWAAIEDEEIEASLAAMENEDDDDDDDDDDDEFEGMDDE